MNLTGFRRGAMILVFLLWVINLRIYYDHSLQRETSANTPPAMYKLRAYSTQKDIADKIKNLGEQAGFSGSLSRDTRETEKFMGYVIIQDFVPQGKSDNAIYINEYLRSRGYDAQIIPGKNPEKMSIRVGDIYQDEASAKEVAEDIYKQTRVSFDARKYFKKVPYKAYLVIFMNIRDREDAESLKSRILTLTSDVEIITY